jgi:3-oxoacyl-[acyl-carrier protein] reductase
MSDPPAPNGQGERKLALVTGAAQGIGRSAALRLAGEGYDLAIVARQQDRAQQVVDELERLGSRGAAYGLDVSKPELARQAVADVVDRFGRIDVLVNNAGTHLEREVVDLTEEIYDTIMDTNLKAAFVFSQAVLPTMISQGSGVIINISSVWAWGVGPGATPYCASKAGVSSLTRTLATEVGKHGIRVNAIAPGLIETDMYATVNESQRAAMIADAPLGRLGTPDEIAGPLAFLVSRDASWITGETLAVSGGNFLR